MPGFQRWADDSEWETLNDDKRRMPESTPPQDGKRRMPESTTPQEGKRRITSLLKSWSSLMPPAPAPEPFHPQIWVGDVIHQLEIVKSVLEYLASLELEEAQTMLLTTFRNFYAPLNGFTPEQVATEETAFLALVELDHLDTNTAFTALTSGRHLAVEFQEYIDNLKPTEEQADEEEPAAAAP